MKRICLALIILITIAQSSYSQTILKGGIYKDSTITKAGNPYLVTGDLTIGQGAVLNIESGVILQFDYNTKIDLRGQLNAVGAPNDSIIFQFDPNSSKYPFYKGIYVQKNDTGKYSYQINMEYCIVEDAREFLSDGTYIPNGKFSFKHCTFRNNELIMKEYFNDNEMYFDSCTFINNKSCLEGGYEYTYITNCNIINNQKGIRGGRMNSCYFTGNIEYGAGPGYEINNCIFYNNNVAIKGVFTKYLSITNNEIVYNSIGVIIDAWIDDTATNNAFFSKNTICHNSAWNIKYTYYANASIHNNCFCTNDSVTIWSKVSDGYVDNSSGIIKNLTYYDSCSTNLPDPNLPTRILGDNDNKLNMKFFPNPTTGMFLISFDKKEEYTISITSADGRALLMKNIYGNRASFDISNIPNGLYFISATSTKKSITKRLVKH